MKFYKSRFAYDVRKSSFSSHQHEWNKLDNDAIESETVAQFKKQNS